MVSNPHQCDEDTTVLSSSAHILRNVHWITAVLSTANPTVIPPIASQSLEAALKVAVAPNRKVEGEDTFSGLADTPVSE